MLSCIGVGTTMPSAMVVPLDMAILRHSQFVSPSIDKYCGCWVSMSVDVPLLILDINEVLECFESFQEGGESKLWHHNLTNQVSIAFLLNFPPFNHLYFITYKTRKYL